jgi:hypothetical protein
MDDVVKEIKALRERVDTEQQTYVNKLKFEDVLRKIEEEGLKTKADILTPSVYSQKKRGYWWWN